MPLSTVIEIILPMEGKTDEEKEIIAEEILNRLKSESGTSTQSKSNSEPK